MKLKIVMSAVVLATIGMSATTLEGYVWNDTNRNGVKDNGESFINNLTVKLFKYKDSSKNMATKTKNGQYRFNLPDANARYRLNIYTQKELTTEGLERGGKAFRSSYLKVNTLNNYTKVGVTSDASNLLKGYIWSDKNSNGKKDNDEPFINNLTVKLFKYKDSSKNMATKTKNGQYEFHVPDVNSKYRLNVYTQDELTTEGLERGGKALRSSYLKLETLNTFTKVGITPKANEDTIELTSGVKEEGYSIKKGKWSYYKIDASVGDRVITTLSDLNDDADLYVKMGSKQVSIQNNDCYSSKGGTTTESCPVTVTEDTTIYIGVYGYRTTDYSIKAEVQHNRLVYPPDVAFTKVSTKNISRPSYLGSYIDPVFNNKVTRISNNRGNGDVKNKHPYPKRGAWNREMTLLKLNLAIYDAKIFNERNKLVEIQATSNQNFLSEIYGSAVRWSNKESNVLYGIHKNNNIFEFTKYTINNNHTKASKKILYRIEGYKDVRIGNNEGNIDYENKYVILSAFKKNDNKNVYAILFNIDSGKAEWTKKVPRGVQAKGDNYFDWITIDPTGKYIVLRLYNEVYVYDKNLRNERKLFSFAEHGDVGVDSNNNPVYVQFQNGGQGLWVRKLAEGNSAVKLLPSNYGGGHISCRNISRKGWCYVDTFQEGYREVFAVNLDSVGVVERFAQIHENRTNDYMQVNVSPDGTQVLFQSNFNNHKRDTYHVKVGK